MLLEAGPLPEWDASEFDLAVVDFGLAAAEWDGGEPAASELNAGEEDVLDAAIVASYDPTEFLEAPERTAEPELDVELQTVWETDTGDADAAMVETETYILDAYNEAPVETWMLLPGAYIDQPEALGGLVWGGTAEQDPVGNGTAPPPPPPPPAPAANTVGITNVTRPAEANFWSGDTWRVEVHGAANAAVEFYGTFNGVAFPRGGIGFTDGTGLWVGTGLLTAGEVGTWWERWYAGGVQLTPDLSFTVFA